MNRTLLRFAVVGFIGTLLGWISYNIIYQINPMDWNKATTSWTVNYLLGITVQHALHRKWTFVDSDTPYLRSLRGAYVAYSGGLIISTAINFYFVSVLSINLQIAWLVSVIAGAISNFILLRKFSFGISSAIGE